MPERKIAARGGAVRYRTKRIGRNRYMHVAVVRRRGPRGGTTVGGKVRKRKG